MASIIRNPPETLLLSLMVKKTDNKYLQAYNQISANKYSVPMATSPPTSVAITSATSVSFLGNLREEQTQIYNEMLTTLTSTRTCILSVHVGFGKTVLAIKCCAELGLKTLIIIPTSKKILEHQWKEEIDRFIPNANTQILTSKSEISPTSLVHIIGSFTIAKLAQKLAVAAAELKWFVIVDELHLVLSEKGFKNLLYIFPQYMLGLSATPYRLDGSNKLVELFFGQTQVYKKLNRKYTVHAIFTKFTFELKQTTAGRLNWGDVLNQQAESPERNKYIAKIVCSNPYLKFLILCKRVVQIQAVAQECKNSGVEIQAVHDSMKPARDARSLIGSVQKLGVGFSDSTFDALIIAADIQDYFIQYFGRILRTMDKTPIIFDIVDNCGVMFAHYNVRKEIYKDSGGTLHSIKRHS